MPNFDYRPIAREALKRAKIELASENPERLKYAALELRMAIEGLVYDRLQLYQDELTPRDYETWQPRKLMTMLLDIDPWADQSRTLMMGLEEQPGVPATTMTMIGTENVLSMATIRTNYDALGATLHLQTLKQIEDGRSIDSKALRERLEKIVSAIEVVLASSLTNATLTIFVEIECQRCGERLRKRAPTGDHSREVACPKCGAEHRLTGRDNDKVAVAAMTAKISCVNESCSEQMELWQDEFKHGHKMTCRSCKQPYEIRLRIVKIDL